MCVGVPLLTARLILKQYTINTPFCRQKRKLRRRAVRNTGIKLSHHKWSSMEFSSCALPASRGHRLNQQALQRLSSQNPSLSSPISFTSLPIFFFNLFE